MHSGSCAMASESNSLQDIDSNFPSVCIDVRPKSQQCVDDDELYIPFAFVGYIGYNYVYRTNTVSLCLRLK